MVAGGVSVDGHRGQGVDGARQGGRGGGRGGTRDGRAVRAGHDRAAERQHDGEGGEAGEQAGPEDPTTLPRCLPTAVATGATAALLGLTTRPARAGQDGCIRVLGPHDTSEKSSPVDLDLRPRRPCDRVRGALEAGSEPWRAERGDHQNGHETITSAPPATKGCPPTW